MTSKTVYLYDQNTGEFAGRYDAQESPLEPGSYIEPTLSTSTAPPVLGAQEAAIFTGGAWSVVEDFRRTQLYSTADGSPLAVHEFGPLSEGVTDKPRPSASHEWQAGDWVFNLDRAKEAAWLEIKAERDRRIQTGGYKVGSKWYHSDTFSRTQQMGLVMLGANIPVGTRWKTLDSTEVDMTAQLAGQIFGAAVLSDVAVFAVAKAHRAAMEASAEPAAYDFSGDWPAIYGEEQAQ